MDNIYDDLENYNEENIIAELRNENKDLKLKLDEYTSALEKLQKDFNDLSSEYKKLNLNYSSLLKTARAEIERKTQIITNFNREKDMMVLNMYQNKNMKHFNRNKTNDVLQIAQSNREEKHPRYDKNNKNKDIKNLSNLRTVAQIANDRKEECPPPKDTMPSSKTDIANRLLNIAHFPIEPEAIRDRSDLKENIMKQKHQTDTFKSRALVRDRRKSLPAASMNFEQFSTDEEEIISAGSSKDLFSRENAERRHSNRYISDKQNSKISESPSLEDRHLGYHESLQDVHKSRYSRNDNDKYRKRDKSCHRSKKYSSERHRRGPKDYEEPYQRSEHERRRAESPINDKYHYPRRSTRESHGSSYERSHPQDYEFQHQTQDKYPLKHKIPLGVDEPDIKRKKIEQHFRHHDEEIRKLQQERDLLQKKLISEPYDNIQFSSCESPDYAHSDTMPTHQIKEIKLTATTKLEDPRISNKKYVLKTSNGKTALFIAESRNVNIIPVDKSAWGIEPVSMPEALIQKPVLDSEAIVNEIYMDIENPVTNLSMESEELCVLEVLRSQQHPQKVVNKTQRPKSVDKENPFKEDPSQEVIKTVRPKIVSKENPSKAESSENNESSSQKLSTYKIPKIKKSIDDEQEHKITNEITPVEKSHNKTKFKDKNRNPDIGVMDNDSSKPVLNLDKQEQKITKEITPVEKSDNKTKLKDKNQNPDISVKDNDSSKAVLILEKQEHRITDEITPVGKPENKTKLKDRNRSPDINVKNDDDSSKPVLNLDKQEQKVTSEITPDEKPDETKRKDKNRKLDISVKDNDSSELVLNLEKQEYRITDEITSVGKPENKTKLKDRNRSPDISVKDDDDSSKPVLNLNKQGYKITTEITPVGKPDNKTKLRDKKRNPGVKAKDNDSNKLVLKLDKVCDSFLTSKNNELPFLGCKDYDKPYCTIDATAKKVVEDDLELSDDTCDNMELQKHVTKKIIANVRSENNNKDTVQTDNIDTKSVTETTKSSKSDRKHIMSVVVKQERLSVESCKNKPTDEGKKSKSKRKPKHKETKNEKECENKAAPQVTEKPTKRKEKETKTKQINTKFSELFGDTSSLISPEDLGLTSTAVIQLPDNSVPFLEDAQDAVDLNAIKARNLTISENPEAVGENDRRSDMENKIITNTAPSVSVELKQKETIDKSNDVPAIGSEEIPIQVVYKNLEPVNPEKEKDVVKTVIISACVQPLLSIESKTEEAAVGKVEQQIRSATQDVALEALATSTPCKMWPPKAVETDIEVKMPEVSCNSNDSRMISGDAPSLYSSDTNTLDSQTNDADVPDVRIFVRRRRKIVKK